MSDVFTLETIREAEAARRANGSPPPSFLIVHPAMLAQMREAGLSFGATRVHVSGQGCRRPLRPCEG